MKIWISSLALLFSSNVEAFSAIAPSSVDTKVSSDDAIDRSLKGVGTSDDAFDPTSGDGAALTRNNKDEVWVSQVRQLHPLSFLSSMNMMFSSFLNMSHFFVVYILDASS